MNFSLTQEQELLKDGLEKFLAKNYTIDFKKSLLESKSVSSPQIWDSFREMGLFDLFIPEEYSGFKGGPVELMIIMETFGKFLVSEPFLNSVLSSKIISQGALKWQKDILFSMISQGESIISPSIQEPSFNYLPLNVNLVGNFDGDFWTLNGKKNHIINGSISEKFLTIVKTGNTNSLEKDLTFFIIESDLENLDGKEYPFVDGTRALELEFKDLKITGDAVLGEVGSGYSILQNVLDYGVIASIAESIGVLSQIFNLTSTYIRERKQFGLSISQFQVIQHKLVDMYIKVEEAKSMMMMAVSAFDSDEYKERQKKLSSAKSFVNNALKFTIENAIQLHGGMGVAEEMDLALYVKRGLVLQNLFGDKLFHDKNLVALEKNITSASNLQKNLLNGKNFKRHKMKNVKNVGVIGSGLMGTEIAMVFAQHQYKVVLIDNSPVALEQSKKKIDLILKKGIDRGLLTKDDSSNILNNISLEADFNSASNFDLAIEAVFEKISIKENVLKELDQKMPIDSIIASNTSSISITTLSSFLKEERRKLFLGTHFFSPVTRMKLVEVIPCIDTDKECLDSIVSLCTKISKKGIAIKDVVGFAVNRLLHAMIIEAVRLVEEGVASPEDIDTACQLGLGHPIGPFQLLDLTKNSLSVDVQTILENAYGERFKPRPLLKQMVSAGYDGKHVGRGWYNYDKK